MDQRLNSFHRESQAATAETLLLFGERMAKLLGSDSGNVHPLAVAGFVSAVNSPDAAAVLSWLRKMPKLAAMIVFLPQGDFDVAVSEIGDVGSADANDIAVQRPEFEYGIVAELTSCPRMDLTPRPVMQHCFGVRRRPTENL